MQVISGYNQIDHQTKSQKFLFRLFHLNHPNLLSWRKSRFGTPYVYDSVEQYIINHEHQIVAVDCAGWTFESAGITVQCLESDSVAQRYHAQCSIEPDLFTHRPTYVNSWPVLFRYPWYLKYAKFDDFINFLHVWQQQKIYINFDERMIQHNYLKYSLVDLVRANTLFDIQVIDKNFWVINS